MRTRSGTTTPASTPTNGPDPSAAPGSPRHESSASQTDVPQQYAPSNQPPPNAPPGTPPETEFRVHPPHGPGADTPQVIAARERREKRAAILSLVVGVTLLVVKFAAYLLTDSAAIFSDALESIVNVVASAIALYAIWLAHQPADVTHPYGHGKIEFLSAGLEGAMMMVAALVIVLRAAEQLIRGAHVREELAAGLTLMGIAMLVNGALGLYLIRSGKRGGSITLEADGKHLVSDAVTSAGVLLALLLMTLTGFRRLDALTAVAVAAYVAYQSFGLLRRSWGGLMDEQDIEDDRLLRGILDAHIGPRGKSPRICSYHKLRHRHSGRYHWVDFHVMVPASWNIDRGHRAASAIEYEIETALGEGNATAHVEPCGETDCSTCTQTPGDDPNAANGNTSRDTRLA